MVLAFFGYELAERDLVILVETDITGTLFDNLVRIEQLGFDVLIRPGRSADLRAVTARGVPLITAVHTAPLPTYPLPPWGRHTVVVAGVAGSEVALYDPYSRRETAPALIPLAQFESAWAAGRYRMAAIQPR